ncbi:ABC transporter ATP-binding protein [Streptomyces sp. t39]|uniref:ABC transporter ATP-binding protein n=1 Tax=Streptomyces sp. t39 TaxID=1828156 RepID=UPI0011CDDE1E|nr:ABC transporter ATP-binding protein [Streptomyces sp. t39]TXS48813.1 ABC transporter ATP-binding protein [Streptomyces sp. t39]
MALIEVNDLRKSYGGRPVVDGVSLAVEEGEIFGVLGSNGAGKTTTVESVMGLRVPDAGTIRVCGLDPVADRARMTRVVGAQLQESELPGKLTVAETLRLYAACYPDPADWRTLAARLGLEEKLDTRFARLSGGQKQRLAIALALVGTPRIVLLDELTTGLDPAARREVWSLIEDVRASGVTILLVTHFMEEAQRLCDRVAVFDRGRIAALDTPSGLVARSAGGTVISFTPSRPLEEDALAALPGLASVAHHKGRITLAGTDETVNAVIGLLVRDRVSAHQLRVTDSTLDDAFLDLTGAGA